MLPRPHLRVTTTDAEWNPKYIDIITAFYILCLVSTWAIGGKLFSIGQFVISAGNLVYPMTCILGYVLTEIYGFNRTRRLIWTGFGCGLIFLALMQAAVHLPPAPGWKLQGAFAAVNQDAFATLNGQVARTVVGSFTAYVFCQFTNSFIMSKMKVWSNGKNFPLRAFVSPITAQLVDSIVFFSIAFIGTAPADIIVSKALIAWVFKSCYEIVFVPFATIFVSRLKSIEGIEHFDRHNLTLLAF